MGLASPHGTNYLFGLKNVLISQGENQKKDALASSFGPYTPRSFGEIGSVLYE